MGHIILNDSKQAPPRKVASESLLRIESGMKETGKFLKASRPKELAAGPMLNLCLRVFAADCLARELCSKGMQKHWFRAVCISICKLSDSQYGKLKTMVYNGFLAFTHCIFDELFEFCNEAVCGAMPAGKYFSIPMRHHWLQLLRCAS